MLNKYYHSTGAAIGVVSAYALGRITVGREFIQLIDHRSFYNPLFAGITCVLVTGWIFDRRRKRSINLARAAYTAPSILILGAVGGLIFNFSYNGKVLHPDYGLYNEFHDWFLKPLYWISLGGIPLAVVIGCAYYLVRRTIARGEIT